MERWRQKLEELSLSKKIAIAMLLTPILSSLIIFCFYYGYMKEFYREKVEIFQENHRENMTANVKNMLRQIENVSGQVLGLAVLSEDFEGYSQKDVYQKLLLNREVTSSLTNICISNEVIDNIYMLDFDGNSFTSNGEWDKNQYLVEMDTEITPSQKGRTVVLPPHPASYRYLGGSSHAPYMISFVTYLNRYTQSGAIGMIQIDIPYKKLAEAMELLDMTQEDFAFLINKEGMLIYAPNEEDVGKAAALVEYGAYNLGKIWEEAKQGVHPVTSVKTEDFGSLGWTLVQVNSNTMLREEMGKMQKTWIFIFLVCLICAGCVSLSLSHSITKPIMNLIGSMGKVSKGNFDIQVEQPRNKDLAALVASFNSMIQEVDTLMKENIQKEHEKTYMQMTALNAKINSHFLYNTLNTIKWQAISKKQMEIAESIVALIKILEYSCKNTLDLVPMEEELQFIKDYIYIQNIRYGSQVTVNYDLEEACRECLVLKMLLQPIVENALLHAFDNRKGEHVITLKGSMEDGSVKICVYDNGKGFQYEGFDKLTGIGLNNVKERLELHFGKESSLEINSVIGEGTCVTILFPVVREERNE